MDSHNPDQRPDSPAPVGVIVDTNSPDGRLDLVIFPDGILAVRGTYVGVALRAAGAGMVGAGGAGLSGAGAAGAGAAGGAVAGRTYEEKRLSKLLVKPRSQILTEDPKSNFIPVDLITALVLRKRWYGHSLRVITKDKPTERKYSWKPALNKFARVQAMLQATFDDLVTMG
jgi:hypothetical protein